METRLICQLLLFSIFSYCIPTSRAKVTEIESTTRNPEDVATTETSAVATTVQFFRQSKRYRYGYHEKQDGDTLSDTMPDDYYSDDHHDYHHMDHEDPGDTKAMTQPKADYWAGYYDFLINEGSYKFWAVFELATAALLIYSGFAALYYAKVNPPTDDYEDYFLRRRRSLVRPVQDRTFLGLSPETFQLIIDAIAREYH